MTDKISLEEKAEILEAAREVVRVSPSKRRVLEMNDDLLLRNYALIAHKASSLSSQQRDLVTFRLGHALRAGRISMDQITDSVNGLTKLVKKELSEKMKEQDENSNSK